MSAMLAPVALRPSICFQAARPACPPATAAAMPPLRHRQQQQQRLRGSRLVARAELEEIDPMTGEVIAGTAMAVEAG